MQFAPESGRPKGEGAVLARRWSICRWSRPGEGRDDGQCDGKLALNAFATVSDASGQPPQASLSLPPDITPTVIDPVRIGARWAGGCSSPC